MDVERDPLVLEVQAVIDSFDPEGLFAMGAPKDEYLFEARDLAAWIRRGDVMTGDRLQEYWVRRFYPDCGLVRSGRATALAERLARFQS